MSLLARTMSRLSRLVLSRAAPRAFASTKTHDGDFELSAELLRGLMMTNGGCSIATQTIENISTTEVMEAVKACDYDAIANLQWTVECDYLNKMSARVTSTQAKRGHAAEASRKPSSSEKEAPFTAHFLRQISKTKCAKAPRPDKRDCKSQPCWSVDGMLFVP